MRWPERGKALLLLGTSWLFAVAFAPHAGFPDPDLWGRLAMGALLFQNGRFPYHDVFSFTVPHARWIDHEWLTGAVFYQLMAHFGEAGLLIFKYLMMLGIFACLFRLHRKVYRVSPFYAFYALLLLVDLYNIGFVSTVRSHIFTFLFFGMSLYLLEAVRLGQKHRKVLLQLLPLGIIWGNLHGGYAMLLLLLGCYGLGEAIHHRSLIKGIYHWSILGVSFLLLGLCNPYGLTYLGFLWHAWTLDRTFVIEWTPLPLGGWTYLPAQCLFLFISVLILLRFYFRNPEQQYRLITPTLVLGLLVAMMLKSLRIQVFLAWASVAYLPLFLDRSLLQCLFPERWLSSMGNLGAKQFKHTVPLLLLIFAIGQILLLQGTGHLLKNTLLDESSKEMGALYYPVGAIEFLKRSPYYGNVYVRFGLGEFLLWSLYPRFKVSMDGRYEEVYAQSEFLENHWAYQSQNLHRNQASFEGINQSKADFLLMHSDLPVNRVILGSRLWQLIYADTYFLIYLRKSVMANYPAYIDHPPSVHHKISIGDLFTDADLKRFKTSEY